MKYINPYLLLKFNNQFEKISELEIKRAKRIILSELELSDNQLYLYEGIELSKSDILKILDDLDDPIKRKYHVFIYYDKKLYSFLTKADLSFFENYEQRNFYADKEFIKLISPYFVEQYSLAFRSNFIKNDINGLKVLLNVPPHITKDDFERCFEITYKYIEQIQSDLISLTNEIKNKKEYYRKNTKKINEILGKKINFNTLNLLPQYFHDINNKIATQLNILSVIINNNYADYTLANKIAVFALNIKSDESISETITNNIQTYDKNLADENIPFENILENLNNVNDRVRRFGKNSIDASKLKNYILEIISESNINYLLRSNLNNIRKKIVTQIMLAIDIVPYNYKIELYKSLLKSNILDEKNEEEILEAKQSEQKKHKIKIYAVYASIIIFITYLIIISLIENKNVSDNKKLYNNNYSNQPNYNSYDNQNQQENNSESSINDLSSSVKSKDDYDYKSNLLKTIQSEKSELNRMENEIRSLDDRLDIIKNNIDDLKQKLRIYDYNISQGIYVNRSLYNSTADRHNVLINEYNEILIRRNTEYTEYQNLLDKINKNIREYNNQLN